MRAEIVRSEEWVWRGERTVTPSQKRSAARSQPCSVWVGLAREQFTAKMAAHFQAMRLPDTAGVTLQLAKRNGLL